MRSLLARLCGSGAVLTLVLNLVCLSALWAPPAAAQVASAAINGTISDSSGAAVPGAEVTATNLQQNTSFKATTNQDGVYNLPRVPLGNYVLTATARGFQTSKQGPFTLILGQNAEINMKLAVGQQSQTVEVTAAAPLLQTETTENSTNISSVTNLSLPLESRNYTQLTLLSAGSISASPTSGTQRPIINGNRAQNDNFMLDGIDNNQTTENGLGYSPSPDAIQEFNLITSNASAEYGNFQGGIVSVEIKSGTNQWHGDAYEFVRNDKLNANSWANNWNPTHPGRSKVRWNDFGATIGGPILHDKLFIFGDYDGVRNDTPTNVNPITVFTAAERQGDFSALTGVQLYDPNNVVNGQRQPFVNNQIPTSEFNSVAKALFSNAKLYPLPINTLTQNNQTNTTRSYTNTNQGDVRGDWVMSTSDHMFGRFSVFKSGGATTDSFPLILGTTSTGKDYNIVGDWAHTLGTNFVNEVRLGLNYVSSSGTVSDNGLGNIADTLGITDGNSRGPGLMALTFSGNGVASNLGNINTNGIRATSVIEYEDQMVITLGRHLLHTGFQGIRNRENFFYGGNNGLWGTINFDGQFTSGPSNTQAASKTTGSGLADFVLGLPYQLGRGPGTGIFGQRDNELGAYVQDDWRVSPDLTLNLGVRYQVVTPLYEVYNRQVNFDEATGTPEYAGQTSAFGNNRALYNPTWGGADLQPRLGFAWSPSMFHHSTVVRGAYDMATFMEGTGLNLRLPINPPFGAEYLSDYSTLTYPTTTLDQGLSQLSLPTDPFHNATVRVWDPGVQPGVTEQWNFSIQHQLSNSTVFQVGYVGEHGTHLVTAVQMLDGVLPGDCTRLGGKINGVPCSTTAVSPSPYFAGTASNPAYIVPAAGIPIAKDIKNISATVSNGNMRYNSLQATLQRRFATGLTYQFAYTWSKCMTDSGGFYGDSGQTSSSGEIYAQDTYNRDLEWGPCVDDVTQNFNSYVVYLLPVGSNKAFNLGRAGNAVLGNWNVGATWMVHTGFAMSPSSANNSGNGDGQSERMDCTGPVQYLDTPNANGGIQWFSTSSFAVGQKLHVGTCGRGVVRGPGLDTINFSLQRDFTLTESKRVEIRSDVTNLTNSLILSAPTMSNGSNLGRISAASGSREIELGLKFYF